MTLCRCVAVSLFMQAKICRKNNKINKITKSDKSDTAT